jgi:hypothetical protein
MLKRVTSYSSPSMAARQAIASPSPGMAKGWRSGGVEGGEAKLKEDYEDEYRAPYLARQMPSVGTRTPGDPYPLSCLACGADETPSSPQSTHKAHKEFTLVQAARRDHA